MTLKRIFRRHLPLITPRIGFEVQPLPPPPPITLRMNLAEKIKPPTGRSPDATGRPSTSKATRSATKKVEATKRRDPTPRAKTPRDPTPRAKTPVPAIASDSDLSDLELEPDSGLGKLASDPKQPSTSRKAKIKKPLGEPGRPHSGGFSLEGALEALGWSKDDFDSFRKRTNDLVAEILDDKKSFTKQASYKLDRVYRKLEDEFPRLRDYDKCWPAVCAVKAKLKSSSEIARRQVKGTSPHIRESSREESEDRVV